MSLSPRLCLTLVLYVASISVPTQAAPIRAQASDTLQTAVRMSTGSRIAIVIFIFALVASLIFASVYLYFRQKKLREKKEAPAPPPMPTMSHQPGYNNYQPYQVPHQTYGQPSEAATQYPPVPAFHPTTNAEAQSQYSRPTQVAPPQPAHEAPNSPTTSQPIQQLPTNNIYGSVAVDPTAYTIKRPGEPQPEQTSTSPELPHRPQASPLTGSTEVYGSIMHDPNMYSIRHEPHE